MGAIDIVPGVSGSTVAVLLGIYERFIAALKNIDRDLLNAFGSVIRHPLTAEKRADFKRVWCEKDMPWLVNLVAGLFAAMACASFFIPWLMEHYPVVTRGFFFGLVLGSTFAPIKTLKRLKITECLITLAFAGICFVLLGQNFEPPCDLVAITASPADTIAQIVAQRPTLVPPEDILQLPQNESVRALLPNLTELSPSALATSPLPEGTTVMLPTLPYWFAFVAGFLAICAMLLPGISGSFILLVFGVYYAALNAAKGSISSLLHAAPSAPHFLTLILLALGAVVGMAAFSRVLTWLFKTHTRGTYAAIIGILLGCLRAVWPFRQTVDDVQVNTIPTLNTPSLLPTILAMFIALAIVAAALILQHKKQVSA